MPEENDDLDTIRKLDEEDCEDKEKEIEVITLVEDESANGKNKTSKSETVANVRVAETRIGNDNNALSVLQKRPFEVSSMVISDNGTG